MKLSTLAASVPRSSLASHRSAVTPPCWACRTSGITIATTATAISRYRIKLLLRWSLVFRKGSVSGSRSAERLHVSHPGHPSAASSSEPSTPTQTAHHGPSFDCSGRVRLYPRILWAGTLKSTALERSRDDRSNKPVFAAVAESVGVIFVQRHCSASDSVPLQIQPKSSEAAIPPLRSPHALWRYRNYRKGA